MSAFSERHYFFRLFTSRGDMSTRTYNPSGHFTSATCIALLDKAPCQAKNVAHQYGCWVKCKFVKTIYIQKVKREKGIYNKWLKTLYSESTARNLSSFIHISILLVFQEKTSYLFQPINIICICKILQCYML